MIEILIITHGKFGKELIRSAELIVGKQEQIYSFGLEHGDDVSELASTVCDYISQKTSQGKELIVFTDIFGGSPSNIAIQNLKKLNFYYITGVNLPMLIEALIARLEKDITAEQLTGRCTEVAKEGIRNISIDSLNSRQCK